MFELILQLKDYRLMGLVMAVEAAKISTFRQQLQYLVLNLEIHRFIISLV